MITIFLSFDMVSPEASSDDEKAQNGLFLERRDWNFLGMLCRMEICSLIQEQHIRVSKGWSSNSNFSVNLEASQIRGFSNAWKLLATPYQGVILPYINPLTRGTKSSVPSTNLPPVTKYYAHEARPHYYLPSEQYRLIHLS